MSYPDWAAYSVQLAPETAEALADIYGKIRFQHAGEGMLVFSQVTVNYLCRIPEEFDGAMFDTTEGLIMRVDGVDYPVRRIPRGQETRGEDDGDDDSGEAARSTGRNPGN